MSFMQRQIVGPAEWLQIETTSGTFFVPLDLFTHIENWDGESETPADYADVQTYCEGKPQSWEVITGFGARLSAPGYMDCTEWAVFETEKEASEYLDDMYPEDEEESE
jgi:hypothetical protein